MVPPPRLQFVAREKSASIASNTPVENQPQVCDVMLAAPENQPVLPTLCQWRISPLDAPHGIDISPPHLVMMGV